MKESKKRSEVAMSAQSIREGRLCEVRIADGNKGSIVMGNMPRSI
jgi:hypothetical protein